MPDGKPNIVVTWGDDIGITASFTIGQAVEKLHQFLAQD